MTILVALPDGTLLHIVVAEIQSGMNFKNILGNWVGISRVTESRTKKYFL